MKIIKRSLSLENNITISNENFMAPTKDHQRNMLINRALKEFVGNLNSLHEQTRYFYSLSIKVLPQHMPEDVIDTWWAKSIAVLKAIK
ncbi:hypothetical protein [Algibacter mikhailovii]|uniref:Uncharacterized protein n=1 Tax=Algibacter mikhailovii TaxID=425498 RepID=A0A918V5L0_9FLAO|nr:hypothetical protein [Algibacter mikhailovii]GGZ71060.1 hypothetical protein GCM10007028_05330 [Algibacter mikhailovii]